MIPSTSPAPQRCGTVLLNERDQFADCADCLEIILDKSPCPKLLLELDHHLDQGERLFDQFTQERFICQKCFWLPQHCGYPLFDAGFVKHDQAPCVCVCMRCRTRSSCSHIVLR